MRMRYRMKKGLALFLALIFVFPLSGCTEKTPVDGTDDPPKPVVRVGEAEDEIPVPLQMNRVSVQRNASVDKTTEEGERLRLTLRASFEALSLEDEGMFPALSETLSKHTETRTDELATLLETLQTEAEPLTPEDAATQFTPDAMAKRGGLYVERKTVLHRADTRVVSFEERASLANGETAFSESNRAFSVMTIDTQTGNTLALSDVIADLDRFRSLLQAKAEDQVGQDKGLFSGDLSSLPFTLGYQGTTVYLEALASDVISPAPSLFLSFQEAGDALKGDYTAVPKRYSVPYDAIVQTGFDLDGDGDMEHVELPGELGESWMMLVEGKPFLATYSNETNPWEVLTDSQTEWTGWYYEFDEAGPSFLAKYSGKPYGNCPTDPNEIRLQTDVTLNQEITTGNPNEPVIRNARLLNDGTLFDTDLGAALPQGDGAEICETVPASALFGAWEAVLELDGENAKGRLEFYPDGTLYYDVVYEDKTLRCAYQGRWSGNHDMPGAQYPYGLMCFHMYRINRAEGVDVPLEFWSMNDITYPDASDTTVIRIESEGDSLSGIPTNGEWGTIVFSRPW